MKHEVGYRLMRICSSCDGTGAMECGAVEIPCPECDGVGEVEVQATVEDLL